MVKKGLLWSAPLFLLSSTTALAEVQETVQLDDPVLRWARGAALLAGALAIVIIGYAAFVRRELDSTGKWLLLIGLVILPLFVSLSGTAIVMEQSKQVAACASCHTMHPFVNDLKDPESETLAARHYQNRWIPDHQCYSCHTDYHIFGKARAKLEGVRHLLTFYTGRYKLPIRMAAPYRNSICLHCHGEAKSYLGAEIHREISAEILSNNTSCVECHGPAHPAPEERARK